MKKKNLFKLILDTGMVIVLVLMYNKRAINMSFHEIGGLILLGVFLIHILLNGKWVVVVTKKFFDPTLPLKSKFGYVLNVLLLISFLLTGISGVFISKTLFHFTSTLNINWTTVHYTSSAVALALIGIHVGLHMKYISGIVSKIIHLPKKVSMIIGLLLIIAIFSYGCYSFTTTSYLNWLKLPFTSSQIGGNFDKGDFKGMGGKFKGENRPDFPSGGNGDKFSGDMPSGDGFPSDGANNELPSDGTSAYADTSNSSDRHSEFAGGFGMDGGIQQNSGIATALKTIANFLSIAFVFATITALIEMFIHFIKQKKKVVAAEKSEPIITNSMNQNESSNMQSIKQSEPSYVDSTKQPDPSNIDSTKQLDPSFMDIINQSEQFTIDSEDQSRPSPDNGSTPSSSGKTE